MIDATPHVREVARLTSHVIMFVPLFLLLAFPELLLWFRPTCHESLP